MITIKGKYNTALCFCRTLDEKAESQIKELCDQEAFADSKIRIMPDVHAGLGCTIGTTMTVTDKIVPGMVGVDIGCGMETVKLATKRINFDRLDALIRSEIPSGRNIRKQAHPLLRKIDLDQLVCKEDVDLHRARNSIGTLGGGNHFIEVGQDEQGQIYLVIHSGSRHLGYEVAGHYQELAFLSLSKVASTLAPERELGNLQSQQTSRKKKKKRKSARKMQRRILPAGLSKDMTYLQGELFHSYIQDMKIICEYAKLNRQVMVDIILQGMGLEAKESFTTVHNYVDTKSMILRKGAVSALRGEKLLIPINMRDGSLICVGKGNEEWNQSAPHGAGRLMSRREAFAALSFEKFRQEMSGIYTTSVDRQTLDEAPMAYKSMDEIISQIHPTAEITAKIRPLYNFKAPN